MARSASQPNAGRSNPAAADTATAHGVGAPTAPMPGAGGAVGDGPRPGAKRVHSKNRPLRRRDSMAAYLALAACLALAATPMLVELTTDVVSADEARTLVVSTQTWRDLRAMPRNDDAQVLPTPRLNRHPLLRRPPGVTWLHLAAFAWADEQASPSRNHEPGGSESVEASRDSIDPLIQRGRLVSVAFGLLIVAAVFWAGMSIGGLSTATLGALACLSLPLLIYESRLATGAIPQAGLALLSTAAALWAARPLKPAPPLIRQALGWTLCGIALGGAVLVGGLGVAPKELVPLAVILAICPRRIGYLLARAAAVFSAMLMVTPWALHVHARQPEAWRGWLGILGVGPWSGLAEYARTAGYRLLWLAGATLPWTLWLIGGLVQPMSTSSVGSRQRMFIGWAWFVTIAALLVLAPRDEPAEMLLALPAGALLIGQLFRQYSDLSAQGRHVRYWRMVRFVYLVGFLSLSIALPLALANQAELIRHGWLAGPITPPVSWMYWAGLGAALVGITALSMRFALQHHPGRTLVCWVAWMVAAMTVIQIPLARGPLYHNPVKHEAQVLASIVGDTPVAYLARGDGPPVASDAASGFAIQTDDRRMPHPALLLYGRLAMPRVSPERLDQLAEQRAQFYLLTSHARPPGPSWRSVYVLRSIGQHLWRKAE